MNRRAQSQFATLFEVSARGRSPLAAAIVIGSTAHALFEQLKHSKDSNYT